MASSKITTVGNSAGIVLPREVLAKLKVDKGDVVYFTETPYGVTMTPYDPQFEAEMDSARRVMRRNREALRRLAR